MTFAEVYQLNDDPIVITTFSDKITVADVEQAELVLEQMYSQIGENVILIIDASQAELDFGEVFKIARFEMRSSAKHANQPVTLKQLFVSTHKLVSLSVELARQKQFGGHQFPLFQTLEDAIEAAHQMIQAIQVEKNEA